MSQNILLLYGNRAGNAVFSGGEWQMPVSNLGNPDTYRVARSVDAAPESTYFHFETAGPNGTRAICLGPTNLSTGHSYRITGYSDEARETMLVDTGWVMGSPRAPWNSLDWTDPDFWLGLVPWDDPERGQWLIHIFDSQVAAQYWTVELDDPQNAAGYVQAGILFIGRHWQPSFNYGFDGNGLSFADNSLSSTTLSGSVKSWRRTNPRVFRFGFSYLPETELYRDGYDFQRLVGYDGQVFVIPDPDDVEFRHRRSFLGQCRQMDGLSQTVFERGSTGFEIREII